MVFCAINLRTNIGIAIVCMVNSTAYTSKAYDNGSVIIVESRNPECVNKNNQEGVEDLGYHGCIFPCIAALIVKWYPKTERSTIAAIYTSGNQLGASFGTYVSAKLCLLTFLGGWPLIFYIYGVLGLSCVVLWYLFATNKPEENKFISDKEISYLQKTIGSISQDGGRKKKKLDVPWRRMFSSPVTWSVIINRFCYCWKMTVMQMLLPSYFRDVLYLNMSNNGLYTALPFFAQLVSKNICAIVADNLRRSGKVGMTSSTKLSEGIGNISGIFLLSLYL
uniref:Inorganic phosphate cotransporter n=1 Tax=Acrobeloides nanus TaxID=290746 RepID=A0A914E5P2_9BILA